jgi:hypothetical protein
MSIAEEARAYLAGLEDGRKAAEANRAGTVGKDRVDVAYAEAGYWYGCYLRGEKGVTSPVQPAVKDKASLYSAYATGFIDGANG